MSEIKTNTVARINNVDILMIENGEKRVAIKPICEALGIDYPSQYTKLQNDPILSSTVGLSTMVGADKKEREMVTIPFKFAFGWLFRIDSHNVKEEAKETVLKFQIECYNALYNHFAAYSEFVEQKQTIIDQTLNEYEAARDGFKDANAKMKEAERKLKEVRQLSFADYENQNRQMKIQFPEV